MKVPYETLELGSEAWAVSYMYDKDGSRSDHCAIYPVILKDVWLSKDVLTGKVTAEYGVMTPDGRDWGGTVKEDFVDVDFNVLVEKVKEGWVKNQNRLK